MNEELKKFADSLQHAQQGIQIGLMTQAKTREDLELLSEVNNGLGSIVLKIRGYLRDHPSDQTPR
jgi:hypothetical protein